MLNQKAIKFDGLLAELFQLYALMLWRTVTIFLLLEKAAVTQVRPLETLIPLMHFTKLDKPPLSFKSPLSIKPPPAPPKKKFLKK